MLNLDTKTSLIGKKNTFDLILSYFYVKQNSKFAILPYITSLTNTGIVFLRIKSTEHRFYIKKNIK